MLLTHLSIGNYRNIERTQVDCGSRFNLFYGNNGQGKTNFLEAIFFLGTVKSFRHARQAEIISWGKSAATLKCTVIDDNIRHDLAITFEAHGKQLDVDGKNSTRL